MNTLLKTHFDFIHIPNHYTVDICEHLDTLYEYAKKCAHITEMGFRNGTSFTAFLMGQPKKLITYDIVFPSGSYDYFDKMKGETEIHMLQCSTLDCLIEETDLLFIDTLHTYDQLHKELTLHGNMARKYIILHDTETFGYEGENKRKPGLWQAVNEFLHDNNQWSIKEHFKNNNGLTILERDDVPKE